MKTPLVLLALSSLAACTTTRVDDHSYHSSVPTPPVQPAPVKNYISVNVYARPTQQAPKSPPVHRQTDQEFLQYSQGPSSRETTAVPQYGHQSSERHGTAPVGYYTPPTFVIPQYPQQRTRGRFSLYPQ